MFIVEVRTIPGMRALVSNSIRVHPVCHARPGHNRWIRQSNDHYAMTVFGRIVKVAITDVKLRLFLALKQTSESSDQALNAA